MGINEDRDAEDASLCTCQWGANPNCRLHGRNRSFVAITDLVKTSGKNPFIEPVYWDYFCGDLNYWL